MGETVGVQEGATTVAAPATARPRHANWNLPNGLTVEYMPWTLQLYEESPKIESGQLVVPDKPGLGLAFDQAAIKRFQIS